MPPCAPSRGSYRPTPATQGDAHPAPKAGGRRTKRVGHDPAHSLPGAARRIPRIGRADDVSVRGDRVRLRKGKMNDEPVATSDFIAAFFH